jgi:hypothetical protein
MTSEIRTLIELSDIMGIEIECPECHLTIAYPMAKLVRMVANCPHCNQDWFDHTMGRSAETYPALDSLQQIATQLRALTRNDRTDIRAKIRVRIDVDQKKLP